MPVEAATLVPQRPRTTQAQARSRAAVRKPSQPWTYREQVAAAFLQTFAAADGKAAYARTKQWHREHGGAWAHCLD